MFGAATVRILSGYWGGGVPGYFLHGDSVVDSIHHYLECFPSCIFDYYFIFLYINVELTDKMVMVVEKYVQKTGVQRENIRLFIDREQVDLEGGECIDVHILM